MQADQNKPQSEGRDSGSIYTDGTGRKIRQHGDQENCVNVRR